MPEMKASHQLRVEIIRRMQWQKRLGFHALQHPSEIAALIALIDQAGYKTCLEIGTRWGGTADLLGQFAGIMRMVLLDIRTEPLLAARINSPHVRAAKVICGDSRSPEVISEAGADPAGYDVVIIDGDHSYEGVRKDFDNYARMARPGGIIVLHDIAYSDEAAQKGKKRERCGVPQLWREVKDDYEHIEIVKPDRAWSIEEYQGGIGALFVGEEA